MLDFDMQQAPWAYCYDTETFELLRTEKCGIDPLESELVGKPVWLVPAYSTLTSPTEEAAPGYTNVWDGAAWTVKEDHRGKEYWLPGDSWQTEPTTMQDFGPLPKGAVLERPAKTSAEITVEHATRVRSERNARIAATDYLMAADYPLNQEDRACVAAYRQALRDMPQQEGFPWDGGEKQTPWPESSAGTNA